MTSLDEQVAGYLEWLASEGKKIAYSDLLQHFGFPPVTDSYRWHQSPMPKIFSALDGSDIDHKRPLRTSVVVRKSKSKTLPSVPGNGYFKTLCAYRSKPIPHTIAEKRAAHDDEVKLLTAYYRV